MSNGIDSGVEEKLRIRFVTATELKQNGRIAQRPDFQMIVARVTERLTNLSELYGEALAWNWRGLVAGAGAVKLVDTQFDARSHQTMRYSTKTGQSHGVGGIKGSATYFGRVGLTCRCLKLRLSAMLPLSTDKIGG